MEYELEKKIFIVENYPSKEVMKENIKQYIKFLKNKYPYGIITKEFYKNNSILVRATQVMDINRNQKNTVQRQQNLEQKNVIIKGHEGERGAR